MKRIWPCITLLLLIIGVSPASMAGGLKYVETANGSRHAGTRNLIQWTHTRLVFSKPLERVAVGQESTLEVEVLGSNEVLALAKNVGRTTVKAWYTDQTTETFLFSVVQDLAVLRRALRDVHPGIRIELAPDRAALVLRGQVPTIKYRLAAESVAQNYLEVGNRMAPGNSNILVKSGGAMTNANLRVMSSDATPEYSAAVINNPIPPATIATPSNCHARSSAPISEASGPQNLG